MRRLEPTMMTSLTWGAKAALDGARSRRNALRALVRAHQDLVAAQWQSTQAGGPADPGIERDLAAIAERISAVLASRRERQPEHESPALAGDDASSDSLLEPS